MTERTHTLYRFWDADDVLLYVGITSDPGRRWKQHHKQKSWWSDVARATLEHFPNRIELEEAERAAIVAERPRHNIVYNRGTSLPRRESRPERVVLPSDMPDMCHDHCVPAGRFDSMYYPYEWVNGVAHYRCNHGHYWTCGWGHTQSGKARECRGVDQAAVRRLERARAGERIPAWLTESHVTRQGTVLGVVGDCPFCGSKHTHGLGADPDRPLLGPRVAHCGVSATYHLELPPLVPELATWSLDPLTIGGRR